MLPESFGVTTATRPDGGFEGDGGGGFLMGRLLCVLGFHRMKRRHHNIISCVRCRRMRFATCPSGCPDCRWERAEAERRFLREVL